MDTHVTMTTTMRNTSAADARRKALRAWIDARFAGSQAAYIRDAKLRGVTLSQSEISQLLGTKSFGENKAETLERQSGMPAGYLVRASMESSRVREPTAPAYASPAAAARGLLSRATPRSRRVLEAIIRAADAGALTDADLDLLGAIARRFQEHP